MAATNVQKTPFGLSLNRATSRIANNMVHRQGQKLPCSVVSVDGSIITVKFEINQPPFTLPQATIPLFGPEYIRYPIQVGDKGFAIAADAQIGHMTGLSNGGTPGLERQPNLSALTFMPIGNKNWEAPEDPDAVIIYGKNGVILRDKDKKVTFTLTPSGVEIDLHGNGNVTIKNGDLHVTGAVIAGYGGGDQVGLQTHRHTQPNDSHGDGEQPTNPPTAGT